MKSRPGIVEVIGIGWRYTSDNAIDATAPDAQIMKIQLDTCAASSPNCPTAAICTGTIPTAYQINVVTPAAIAAMLASRRSAPARELAQGRYDGTTIHRSFRRPSVDYDRHLDGGTGPAEHSASKTTRLLR